MLSFIIKFTIFILNLPVIIKCLHLYQLKDYSDKRYIKSLSRLIVFLLSMSTTIFLLYSFCEIGKIIIYILNFATIILLYYILPKSKKTPLKYTNKTKRILSVQIIITFLLVLNLYVFIYFNLFACLSPVIANMLNIYDKIKNHRFVRIAKEKLQKMNVKIIAITGSNGKTSVKNILTSFLKIKYKAIATPSSFNTPLGIAKFINNLDEDFDIIILEFGARKRGDIKKLCELFTPNYGIVTMVGDQHLATFKNYKNIYYTKAELSRFLGNEPCIYNLDNLGTNTMYHEKSGEKYAISICDKTCDLYAENIKIIDGKTHFDLVFRDSIYHCKTKLLGKHNITNIMLCFSLASLFGVDEHKLIEHIENIEQTQHRLSLIKTDIFILDDTYNCSLSSAQSSLEVLSQMPNKKMVVTPGIIEGGKFEEKINQDLGKMMATFDYVVIVGKHNKESILFGLKQKNCIKKILLADTIDDAKQYFRLLNKNDSLLLLNDLPDDYH